MYIHVARPFKSVFVVVVAVVKIRMNLYLRTECVFHKPFVFLKAMELPANYTRVPSFCVKRDYLEPWLLACHQGEADIFIKDNNGFHSCVSEKTWPDDDYAFYSTDGIIDGLTFTEIFYQQDTISGEPELKIYVSKDLDVDAYVGSPP